MTGDPKRYSTLQARAAICGAVLNAVRADAERWTFVVTAAAISRELESLDAVEGWLVELVERCDQSTEGTDAR